MIGSFMSDVSAKPGVPVVVRLSPSGCGQKDMGVSGPAQGQGIAKRSGDGLRMVRPAFKRAAPDAGLPCDEAMILPQCGVAHGL
jgi:hypothetical protein